MVKTIVLDAGHGGHDAGAVGNGLKEKDLTLSIALETERYLKENYTGHRIVQTRRTDVFLSLQQRTQISNNNRADLFVSIHINSASATAHGYESFISPYTKSGAMLTKVHNGVRDYFRSLGIHNRGLKKTAFYVLRYTTAPSILTESLFISNPQEAKILRNNIRGIAKAHADGIAAALGLKKKERQKDIIVDIPTTEMEVLTEMKLNTTTRKDIMHLNNYAVDQGIFSRLIVTKAELEEVKKTPGWTDRYNKVALEDMTDDELKNKYLSYLARKEYKNK